MKAAAFHHRADNLAGHDFGPSWTWSAVLPDATIEPIGGLSHQIAQAFSGRMALNAGDDGVPRRTGTTVLADQICSLNG